METCVFLCIYQNLSPVLTRMTKEVDGREKELTHQVHREMLIRSLEQVKNLTPVLISGIKIYITAKQSSKFVGRLLEAGNAECNNILVNLCHKYQTTFHKTIPYYDKHL